MKKTIRIAGTSVLLLAMAAAPALAKSFKNYKGFPQGQNCPRDMNYNEMPQGGRMGQPGNNGRNGSHHFSGFMGGKFSLFGEVTAVDEGNSILTVKDVDGNDHKVHMNGLTITFNRETEPKEFDKFPERNQTSAKEFKKGDKVAVSSFETETKTIEARCVLVLK